MKTIAENEKRGKILKEEQKRVEENLTVSSKQVLKNDSGLG